MLSSANLASAGGPNANSTNLNTLTSGGVLNSANGGGGNSVSGGMSGALGSASSLQQVVPHLAFDTRYQ